MKKEYIIPMVKNVIVLDSNLLSGSGVDSADLPGIGGYGGVDNEGSVIPSAPKLIMMQ